MKITKRILSLALCAVMLMLCGCGGGSEAPTEVTTTAPAETIDHDAPLTDGKTLKMLVITSSFGLNTTQWLYNVAKAEGFTDVVIGRLYGSGCSLQLHVSNANSNAMYYEYTKIDNDTGRWNLMQAITMEYGLKDEDWDIIFVQQSAANAGLELTYGDYVDQLMAYLHEHKTNPKARFIWNMTWAYQSDSTQTVFTTAFNSDQMKMYNTITDITKRLIAPRTDFDRIIPSGTVIQNARTSAFGDNLCRDTFHLNNYGGILAAYGLLSVLTDRELTEINLDPVPFAYNGLDNSAAITEPFTENQKAIIIESVNNAIKNPFEVTQSTITEF